MITKYMYSKFTCGLMAIMIVALSNILIGCKKNIEVGAPLTSITNANVYSLDATAIAAVTALYTKLGSSDASISTNLQSITYDAGLSADELSLYPGGAGLLLTLYRNELAAISAPSHWNQLYPQIYIANAAIEGLTASTTLIQSVKQQLLGEAKFMRAFNYYFLVNFYGDVPLATNTDYKVNSLSARTLAADVWQQIIKDLLEAKELMNSDYVGNDVMTSTPTTERIRPNKWVAAALLARAYLNTGDYANAEAQATEIINNNSLYNLSIINNTFLKNPAVNKEAIWQIQPITANWNTNDARIFILPTTGPSSSYPLYLNRRLIYDFESGDIRKTNWIKGIKVGTDSFYHAYKYKSAKLNDPVTEYSVVFRLAEQYLIRAEARAMQNKFQQAIDDVNTIRLQHGGLSTPLSAPSSQAGAISIILHERRVELFCEWGLRWFDLKRTNMADAIMSVETPLKGGTWQSTDKLYPISLDEIKFNRNLTQTLGY